MHSVIHSWSTNLPWCRFLAAIICWCCIALYAFLHAEICCIASQNIICAPQEAGTAAFCPAPSRDRRDNYGVPVSLQVTKEDVSFGCLFSVVLLNKMLLLSILVLIMKCVAGPELWRPQPPPYPAKHFRSQVTVLFLAVGFVHELRWWCSSYHPPVHFTPVHVISLSFLLFLLFLWGAVKVNSGIRCIIESKVREFISF